MRAGLFGKIRIYERVSDGARFFMTGSSVQTLTDADGVSLFGYINAFKLLLRPYRKVLMLGGGGGSLATMLARKGHDVTVVDIDPVAKDLARQYFRLDSRVRWITADARAFVFNMRIDYDAIVIDACNSTRTVGYFCNAAWIARAAAKLKEGGALLLNLAGDETRPHEGEVLASNVAMQGLHATLLQPSDGWEGNELIIASTSPTAALFQFDDIRTRPTEAQTYLMSLKAVSFPSARTPT
jgi:spermidine synthase